MRRNFRPPLRTKEEADKLVADNQGILHLIVYRILNRSHFLRCRIAVEDALQEAQIGAMRAALVWDKKREANFCTYIARSVHNAVIQAAMRQLTIAVPRYVQDALHKSRTGKPYPEKHGKWFAEAQHAMACRRLGATQYNCTQRDDEEGETEQEARLHEALGHLRPRDQAVLDYRFRQGLTLRQAGDALGLTSERVRQIQCTAMRKLRRELCREAAA